MSFTIHNCRITVSFFFVAMVAIVLLEDKSGTSLLAFLAAALHEAGHLIVMRAFGVKPSQIRFTPFGIDIIKSCCVDRSYRRDALISFAGPCANIAMFLLLSALQFSIGNSFMLANLIFALFNLLPIEPLDGGQALYSLLCMKFSADQSAKAVAIVSFAVLTPLAIVGFLTVFRSPGNYSLLLVCGYLMALLLFKNGRYY
jgi:stage IV sporulation protein FB